ncbi:MAG: hypothetical protein ACRC6M_19585 [Microcystaceae cyanobacterium]
MSSLDLIIIDTLQQTVIAKYLIASAEKRKCPERHLPNQAFIWGRAIAVNFVQASRKVPAYCAVMLYT